MNRQIQALLMIAQAKPVLLPAIDCETFTVNWGNIRFNELSCADLAIMSWAWSIWMDLAFPRDDGMGEYFSYRLDDPFYSFSNMDFEMKRVVLKAFAYRHGLIFDLPSAKQKEGPPCEVKNVLPRDDQS